MYDSNREHRDSKESTKKLVEHTLHTMKASLVSNELGFTFGSLVC